MICLFDDLCMHMFLAFDCGLTLFSDIYYCCQSQFEVPILSIFILRPITSSSSGHSIQVGLICGPGPSSELRETIEPHNGPFKIFYGRLSSIGFNVFMHK